MYPVKSTERDGTIVKYVVDKGRVCCRLEYRDESDPRAENTARYLAGLFARPKKRAGPYTFRRLDVRRGIHLGKNSRNPVVVYKRGDLMKLAPSHEFDFRYTSKTRPEVIARGTLAQIMPRIQGEIDFNTLSEEGTETQ